MNEEIREWYRKHGNGWIGSVTLDEDGQYSWGVSPVLIKAGTFASSLEAAQQEADDAVVGEGHDCGPACGPWTKADASFSPETGSA